MAQEVLSPSLEALAQVCRRYGVRRLWVFGSFARGEADEQSDLDLLVEFYPGQVPGLDFIRLEEELYPPVWQAGRPPYGEEPEPPLPRGGPEGGQTPL